MNLKEGQNISRPPVLLEGPNYGYWKVRMKAFLKSLDEKAWKDVLVEWTHFTTKNAEGKDELKTEDKWTEGEEKAADGNLKTMNAIFSAVGENIIKLISTREVVKDAWDTLRTAHEGTEKVKTSRMQMITSMFESLKMKGGETIAEFNAKLLDLSKEGAKNAS